MCQWTGSRKTQTEVNKQPAVVSVSNTIVDSSDPAFVIHKLGYTHNDRVERHVDANAF
jgi:hypothetical protein